MPNYKLRYFFDAGSGICLWSANDSAREKFGYPIDVSQLNLDENTKRKAYYLLAWYDTCINWNSPADPCSWSTEDRARFKCEAENLYKLLSIELGSEFEIVDELKPV